ncbi:sterile alpha motif domain containing 1a isoform X1 [Syngnathus typhle]|uniref:sterile alpha motif domain containing 1a isoform X1 n=1 Tax=Syngnathus typhle TaxID=161592 RepID=UPI002A6A3F2E|nr:sterile alpha motif domain containing 1a isoform X1 [Syngnathus typhle]
MSDAKYREWILDTIDSLRSRKARPDLERICRMVRRRHGCEPDQTCGELEKLIREQTVLKVNYKGSISYRNAAKVQRRCRKKDDAVTASSAAAAATATSVAAVNDASHSDLSNGDSALGPADPDDDDEEADTSMAMDTDSNMDEEGGDESRDGQDGPFPSPGPVCLATSAVLRAASAPCSPSHARPAPGPGRSPGAAPGAGLDCVISFQMATARPSSLPASSPKSLTYNNLANGTNGVASCPVERQELGMHTDKVCPVTVHPVAICPSAPKNNLKEEDKMEDSSPLLDQLVPDYAVQLERSGDASQVRVQVLSSSNDCTLKKNAEILASLAQAESVHVNGNDNDKSDELSVKKEKLSQNLLQWTAADVASYFADAGFPEQALAFRTQEIDGKSLLLMQRSDVLTGLSIRLGPALKIYERHIKVLQRSHFLECDDL